MDWEKRLKELNGYDISFEVKQGYYHIALVYEEGWNILAPDNEFIYVEERNGVHHYIASIDDVKLDDIFAAIDATINYNMDLQKKLMLFKQKTQELQELFANEDFERLQTIEFVFAQKEEPKKTTKKKQTEKAPRKTKSKSKKTEKKEESTEQVTEKTIEEEMTDNNSYDYDANDEIVTMGDNYMEELER